MNLYRVYRNYCHDPEDVRFIYAEYPEEVLKRNAELESQTDYFREWLDEVPFGELIEDLKGREEIFQMLPIKGFDDFAKAVCHYIDRDEWSVEVEDVPNIDCRVYAVYPKDITCKDDVQLVYVLSEITDEETIQDCILDELAYRESFDENFREHVLENTINMSFNEKFWCDEKGFIFRQDTPFKLREDFVAKIEDKSKVDEYLHGFWEKNVDEFFKDRPEFGELFKQYIMYDAEPDIFDRAFFIYVARKVIGTKDWFEYTVREVKPNE
ncbi:hypothetical protein [Bacillus litorisediminis]|uniref:hypothetical protein n=1 Tax=Bacillus litorisediminis TaxID=2922713 RepID=UPI001FB03BB4|nr:hypothetical protein [Bacillus litorisediminis]